MEAPSGQIWVEVLQDKVCIRVEGRATHLHGPPLRKFATEMIRRGQLRFELDLGRCMYMDSTFLGVLVGISVRLENAGAPLPVVNRVSSRNRELFKTLGVDRFFELHDLGAAAGGQGVALPELNALTTTKSEWAGTVVKAHQLLVEVDDRNEPRFRELLEYVNEELSAESAATGASTAEQMSRWKQ